MATLPVIIVVNWAGGKEERKRKREREREKREERRYGERNTTFRRRLRSHSVGCHRSLPRIRDGKKSSWSDMCNVRIGDAGKKPV